MSDFATRNKNLQDKLVSLVDPQADETAQHDLIISFGKQLSTGVRPGTHQIMLAASAPRGCTKAIEHLHSGTERK